MSSEAAHSIKADTTATRSMTGFASATGAMPPWTFTMDVRGVNGRGLDLRLRVPDWIEGLESEARKRIQAKLSRGSVTLSIRVSRDEASAGLRVNEAALEGALATLGRIAGQAEAAGVDLAPVSASDIASMRGVIESADETVQDTTPLRNALLSQIDRLLVAFDADRAREGADLSRILAGQVDQIEHLTQAAEAVLGDRAEAQRATLERNLGRLLDAGDMPDKTRLEQELALIAVKTDISEEIDRLGTHVAAARALLGETGPVGRKLDFLTQEFNREANTLCSKAQSRELTSIGLDLKTVIDQMREQVQNVE